MIEYIDKRPDACGGKACIKGRRIRVQDVAYHSEWCGWSADQISVPDSVQFYLDEMISPKVARGLRNRGATDQGRSSQSPGSPAKFSGSLNKVVPEPGDSK